MPIKEGNLLTFTFDSEEDDDSADEKELIDMTDEQLFRRIDHHPEMKLNKEKVIREKVPKLRAYLKEIQEFEGFEINNFPGFIFGITTIAPNNVPGGLLESDEFYTELAEWAIEDFNDKNGTEYGDVEVERVNLTNSCYVTYYITFTAVEEYETDTDDDGSDDETEEAIGSNDKTHDDGSDDIKSDETEPLRSEEAIGTDDKTHDDGSNDIKSDEAEPLRSEEAVESDNTTDVASDDALGIHNETEEEAIESDNEIDDAASECNDRKTFEAKLSLCTIGGPHDPEVKFCRLKAPKLKEARPA